MTDAKGQKPPRIVAELGRPETPEETAARKAENSRKHRANQTLRNLVYSLVATLVVVLVLVAVVVRPNPDARGTVDYHQVATDAQVDADVPLSNPDLPDTWTANDASLTTSTDGISTWYIGFITPDSQFISLKQGIAANETWVAQQLDLLAPTSTTDVGGLTWDVYDNREGKDPGNLAYSMVTTVDGTSYVLSGTADTDEFTDLATDIAEDL
jgi:hypothetical protein